MHFNNLSEKNTPPHTTRDAERKIDEAAEIFLPVLNQILYSTGEVLHTLPKKGSSQNHP